MFNIDITFSFSSILYLEDSLNFELIFSFWFLFITSILKFWDVSIALSIPILFFVLRVNSGTKGTSGWFVDVIDSVSFSSFS